MMRLWFFLGGVAVLLVGPPTIASPVVFVNLPALLLVVGGGLLFPLAFHGAAVSRSAIAAAVGSEPLTRDQAHRHHLVLHSLRNSFCAAGAVGFVMSVVGVLTNLSDPKMIGPSMATALLASLYALVLAELIVAPMSVGVLARISEDDAATPGKSGGEPTALASSRGVVTLTTVVLGQSCLMGLLLIVVI